MLKIAKYYVKRLGWKKYRAS